MPTDEPTKRNNTLEPITPKPKSINALDQILSTKPINPKQGVLNLEIAKEVEIEGIGMGVLSDGTPFLSGRGLARLCGVSNSAIVEIGADWNTEPARPRIERIKAILAERGVSTETPFSRTDNDPAYIYPDSVSLAVLEYYAFDAGANVKDTARRNYRILAGKTLRDFIYTQVGYDPTNAVPDAWKQFHDRVAVTFNKVPPGYFIVFKEIADMVVTLGQHGLHIDEHFVPDVSVGKLWSAHWTDNNLDGEFGSRQQCDHEYPSYFSQAASNPQHIYCYPEASLGEFRRWVREHYVGEGKFAKYLEGKVKKGDLPPSFATLALAAYSGDGVDA